MAVVATVASAAVVLGLWVMLRPNSIVVDFASMSATVVSVRGASVGILVLSLGILLFSLRFTTWLAARPARPAPGTAGGQATIRLGELSVTQFVACLFYGATFALVYWGKDGALYDPGRLGFGEISAEMFTNEIRDPQFRVLLGSFVMLGFVAANAWRYFLSFWFVEESGAFRRLVRQQQSLNRRDGAVFLAAEWFLRFVSLMCLYLVQASFGNAGKYVEVLLAAVFAALLAWDCLILWRFDPSLDAENKGESVEFRDTVIFWRRIEGVGFLASIAYIVLAWRARGEFLSTFATVLAIVFMGLAAFDVVRNWKAYRALIIPVVCGTAVAVLATRWILRWL